ncbi:MAG TPA: LptF/LptG family permease, partial [Longimicrobiaceae bacterium]|nr:LptF/LptG family permease [Longimicrobiaceae bacterium]
ADSTESSRPPPWMKILTRYLLRAHLGPFFFAFLALTGVVLINTLARRLADLAGKGLPLRVVLEFFVLALPATVALTFPMAVLVSILYTFSNFTAENEITAMKASGLDLKRLLLPLLAVAAVLTVVMIWFNDRVLPEANHRWSRLFVDIAGKTPTLILQPQTLNRIQPRQGSQQTYYLRAARVDPATNRLFDVSIYDVSNSGVVRSIYADSGRALFNPARTDLVMRLYSGHVREVGLAEPATFRRMAFREQVFGIPGVGTTLPTGERGPGYRGDREMTIGMLEARIDTLRRERAGLYRSQRETAHADLDYALSGGTRPFRTPQRDSSRMALPAADEGGVVVRTRNTAAELESYRLRADQLAQQIREYQVEVHKKYSIAVAALVFVVVGVPLALRFGGGGIGMVIACSMVIFSLYYIGLIGGETLAGRGYVTPLVAMWVVNALMMVLGVLGLATMGRESSTARSTTWDTMLQAFRDFFATVLRRGRPA